MVLAVSRPWKHPAIGINHEMAPERFSFYALDENDGGVIEESRPEIPAEGGFALRRQTRRIPVNFAETGRAKRLLMRSDIQIKSAVKKKAPVAKQTAAKRPKRPAKKAS
jgi:hypothetical protein